MVAGLHLISTKIMLRDTINKFICIYISLSVTHLYILILSIQLLTDKRVSYNRLGDLVTLELLPVIIIAHETYSNCL